jgi:hypothetical protein
MLVQKAELRGIRANAVREVRSVAAIATKVNVASNDHLHSADVFVD